MVWNISCDKCAPQKNKKTNKTNNKKTPKQTKAKYFFMALLLN